MALSLRSKAFGATQRAAVRTPTRAVRMVVRASAQQQQQSRAQLAKAAMTAAGVQLIAAAPAFAEAGKLFDFNLTLPIMAGEILLLVRGGRTRCSGSRCCLEAAALSISGRTLAV
jgi:F-type H+-transporting ATPase subunit b